MNCKELLLTYLHITIEYIINDVELISRIEMCVTLSLLLTTQNRDCSDWFLLSLLISANKHI